MKPDISPWRCLTIDCDAAVAETLGGLLMGEGALGLETEDDDTRAVPGKPFLPTGRSIIVGTFNRESGLEARVVGRLQQTIQYIPKARDAAFSWTDLWPKDWNAIFMSQWKPFRLGRRVWIVPSWERERFSAERVGPGRAPLLLHLDPGMAFGTGQHETTQLCTEAIEQVLDTGETIERLLDVGTGTGILAFVALKLGVKTAKGTDIDPVAVDAAIDNAAENQVADRFVANDDMPAHDGAIYDAVVANILAGTLIELRDDIIGALAPGGRLWLSGVLWDQAPTVTAAFEAAGLVHEQTVRKNEWVRIDLRRPRA